MVNSDDLRVRPAYIDDATLGSTFLPSHVDVLGESVKGSPEVRIRFQVRNGVPEVVEFHLVSTPDGRGIRTTDLRQWLLESLATRVFERFGMRHHFDETGSRLGATFPHSEDEFWSISRDIAEAQAKRATTSDAELREVADIYRAAIHGSPTKAVKVQMDYSERTAARRVRQARDRGFLPQTTSGKKSADV